MAIRLRIVGGTPVALCAAETQEKPGDLYIDDRFHYALAAKFARDWDEVPWAYPKIWAVMDTQVTGNKINGSAASTKG